MQAGTVILDMEASSLEAVVDLLLEHMINNGQITCHLADPVKRLLLRRHRHQFQGLRKVRSEAVFALGQASATAFEASSSSFILSAVKSFADMRNASLASFADLRRNFSRDNLQEDDGEVVGSSRGSLLKQNEALLKKIPRDAEAANILVGEVDCLAAPLAAFVRLERAVPLGDLTEVALHTRFIFILLGNIISQIRGKSNNSP